MVERTEFGRRLRLELDRQNVSARELARRLNPADPESARRNIARWLAPRNQAVSPSRASVASVADALGVPFETLADDDEEEAAQVNLALELLSVLRRATEAVA